MMRPTGRVACNAQVAQSLLRDLNLHLREDALGGGSALFLEDAAGGGHGRIMATVTVNTRKPKVATLATRAALKKYGWADMHPAIWTRKKHLAHDLNDVEVLVIIDVPAEGWPDGVLDRGARMEHGNREGEPEGTRGEGPMDRAKELRDHKYDPVRVKAVVDEHIESRRAKGNWKIDIDDLVSLPRDDGRMMECMKEVQRALRDEGFYVSCAERPGDYVDSMLRVAVENLED